MHRFSVFTATYNRSKYLTLLYQDLLKQTFKDFEWIIVDDGSTDNTQREVESFISDGILDIKYVRHEVNKGKFQAWRTAMAVMKGQYEIGADDDDIIVPRALEIFDREWKKLEQEENYDKFWEIRARCEDENGKLVGNSFHETFDSDYNTFNYILKYGTIELQGCRKVSVLINEAAVPDHFIFEDKASNFPEGIRWSRAARKYKTRFITDIVRIYRKTAESLSRGTKTTAKMYNSLIGDIYLLNEQYDLMLKYRKGLLLRCCLHAAFSSLKLKENVVKYIAKHNIRLIVIIMYPLAAIITLFR